jgi:hypothetical protein
MTTQPDNSRKVNLSQCSKLQSQQEPHQETHENEMKDKKVGQNLKNQKQLKQLLISPNCTEESFLPINRELLHEMAANYRMMELTPDATDFKMLAHNKSLFNR